MLEISDSETLENHCMADTADRGVKRKCLTFEERVKVIRLSEDGLSCRKICQVMGVGKTQVQTIVLKKDEIMQQWRSGAMVATRKQLTPRRMVYGDLNDKLWHWFLNIKGRNVSVSGRMLQDQASRFALEMGYDNFSASNGWLRSFQDRHGISQAVLKGQVPEVKPEVKQEEETATDWGKWLHDVCKDYSPANVFNCGEMGLLFRTLPHSSLVTKGVTTSNGELAKERITVLLAASATGEKLRPLVIGKSANPRCFSQCKIERLGVTYESNKKSWMTGELFAKWLRKLNHQMSQQSRRIILFMNDCSAHPAIELFHVKLAFFPPNATRKLQPINAGIIQSVKFSYRKKMMRHVSVELDESSRASEVARSITLLHALEWLRGSWNLVQKSTIEKCFRKCGFFQHRICTIGPFSSADEDWSTDDLEPLLRLLSGRATAKDLVGMDEATSTYTTDHHDLDTSTDSDPPSSDEEEPEPTAPSSCKRANQDLDGIIVLALQRDSERLLQMASDMKDEIQTLNLIKTEQAD